MKKYLILLAIALTASLSHAATTEESKKEAREYTYTVYGEIPTAKTAFEETHFLGGELTAKWNTLVANYTHVYDVSVGFSDSGTEIVKPAIYNAVMKVNKHYKKALRRKQVSVEEAARELSHIFDCANVLCFEDDTRDFEASVSACDTPEDIVTLFRRVTLVRR